MTAASEAVYVLDAHTLWWFWIEPENLGDGARAAFRELASRQAIGLVPAIVVAELHYLSRRLRQPRSVAEILSVIGRSDSLLLEPITRDHLIAFGQLGEIPEMHDRLIGAVALMHDATLVTRDSILRKVTSIRTIW